jgi:cytochrome c-type biogenesis protein CcmF
LMVVGPFVAWKRGVVARVWQHLRVVALVATLTGAGVALALNASITMALGLILTIWIAVGTLLHLGLRLWPAQTHGIEGSPWPRWRGIPLSFWGMIVAHLGVAVFVLGVTLVRGLDHTQDAHLQEGQSVNLGGYTFSFISLQKHTGPNYIAARASFEVRKHGQTVATLHPEKRLYLVQRMPMTEAAIDRGITRDLYVSLGEATPNGAWGVRVQIKPFMGWVWGGCILMAIGGALAAADRRYRASNRSSSRVQQSAASKPGAPGPALPGLVEVGS